MDPRDVVTRDKQQSKKKGYVEPARRALGLISQAAHECGNASTGDLQGYAATDQKKCIEIEDRRQLKALPVKGGLANDESTAERREHHRHREDHNPDAGRGWRPPLFFTYTLATHMSQ